MTLIDVKAGIGWCVNCVGFHPDEELTIQKAMMKATNIQKDAWIQHNAMKTKKDIYAHKSCMLCGRTYNSEGVSDETFELTAKRVKQEFDNAGVFGVPDEKVKLVVADCRKSVQKLLAIRPRLVAMIHHGDAQSRQLAFDTIDRMTFSGRLAMIITAAQEGRRQKLGIKGGSI